MLLVSQADGRAQPSFITTLLEKDAELKEKGMPNPMTDDDIKGAAGAVFAGECPLLRAPSRGVSASKQH